MAETTGVKSGVGEDGPPPRTVDILVAVLSRSRVWSVALGAYLVLSVAAQVALAWAAWRSVGHLGQIQALMGR